MTRCLKPGEVMDSAVAYFDSWPPGERFENLDEVQAMWPLAAGRRVLEIGTFQGFSAILWALSGAKWVDAVDWHRGGQGLGERDTLCECWANLKRYGAQDTVRLHVGQSAPLLSLFSHCLWDLVFVDGDHDRALLDTALAVPLVAPGGLMVWHDYPHWTVPSAVDYVRSDLRWPIKHLTGSLMVGYRP